MNTKIFALALLVSCALLFTEGRDPRRGGKPSATKGADIFLKGNFLELAVNPAGGFGSRDQTENLPYGGSPIPSNLHGSPRTSKFGAVVDTGKDGWTVGANGIPPQSGDAFLEGYPEVGWHLSWHGINGSEKFNQMPHWEDDDDEDNDYKPYRGCVTCKNKEVKNGCNSLDEDCNCNTDTTADDYVCAFRRWDIDTVSFKEITTDPSIKKVEWVGQATARRFVSSASGNLEEFGEKIRINKTIYFSVIDTAVFEDVELTNVGELPLNNVSLLWHIAPTLEAFPHDGWTSNPELKFANKFSTPFQGSYINDKSLVQAVGNDFGWTLGLGTRDPNSRAWHIPRKIWAAKGDEEYAFRRPYTGDWLFEAPRQASTEATYSEDVAVLAIQTANLAVGETVTKKMFWAFTADAIEKGFDGVPSPNPPAPIGDDRCPSVGTCCDGNGESRSCSNPCFAECVCDEIFGGNAPECCTTAWDEHCVEILETLLQTGACNAEHHSYCTDECSSITTCVPVVTTGEEPPVTTGEESPVTTGEEPPVTTGEEPPVTTGTTGEEPPVTTGEVPPATTGAGEEPVTTGHDATGSTPANVTTGVEDIQSSSIPDALNDRNAKIIGSVFGVAGFLILLLIIAAIILAYRASRRNK